MPTELWQQYRATVCNKPFGNHHRWIECRRRKLAETLYHLTGHFLLTNLLLEAMKTTARESSKEGRILNVSSRRHQFTYPEGIRFDKINDQSEYNSLSAYGQSKLANVLHANELARRLKEEGLDITANALHPGAIATNLFCYHSLFSGFMDLFGKYVIKNVQQKIMIHLLEELKTIDICSRHMH